MKSKSNRVELSVNNFNNQSSIFINFTYYEASRQVLFLRLTLYDRHIKSQIDQSQTTVNFLFITAENQTALKCSEA